MKEVLKNSLVKLLFIGLLVSTALAKYSGGSGEPNDPYLIATPQDMNAIGADVNDWNKHFIMTADVNLQGVTLTPVGNSTTKFTGVFNGNGHIIRNAIINQPGSDYIGLFGYVNGGQISNLGIRDITASGDYFVGGLVGANYYGTISSCYSTGIVSGNNTLGGLVGVDDHGTVSNCYSTGAVSGGNNIGGLIGKDYYGTVSSCYSTGAISGTGFTVGGLIGKTSYGIVSGCYSTGNISGDGYASGLIGWSYYGTASNCYSTGTVGGNGTLGGLVGVNEYGIVGSCCSTGAVSGTGSTVGGLIGGNSGTVSNCYSTGNVSGNSSVGGLVGYNNIAKVSSCYSTGTVSGTGNNVGGFIGYNYFGIVSACFWDTQTSGTANGVGNMEPDPNGITSKTTSEMQTLSTFTSAGWDFVGEMENGYLDIWRMCVDDIYYPKLSWQFPRGDFVCPDGVGYEDLLVFCDQWLLEKLSYDIKPDGIVNFLDYADFANNWQGDMNQLSDFASQWLRSSAYNADIAPAPDGDGIVNFIDFAVFAENWLKEN